MTLISRLSEAPSAAINGWIMSKQKIDRVDYHDPSSSVGSDTTPSDCSIVEGESGSEYKTASDYSYSATDSDENSTTFHDYSNYTTVIADSSDEDSLSTGTTESDEDGSSWGFLAQPYSIVLRPWRWNVNYKEPNYSSCRKNIHRPRPEAGTSSHQKRT